MQPDPSKLAPRDFNFRKKAPDAALKIGGFLIVVAISLIFSFLKSLGDLGVSFVPFRSQMWERLTTPGLNAYHPYWKPVLLFEIISASVIFAFNVILLILFFRKHRFFPTFVVVAIPVIFVLMLVGYCLDGFVPAIAANPIYARQGHAIIVKFIALHVWIPYFLFSERVKRTFVR